MVFPVVMYGCESWTIKNTEQWRIDAFELWCWRRLLRVPWIARRSNQSGLKEISPEYSLEGVMLKVKLQYFGKIPWRRKWQPTPVLLPGKFHGWRSLVGYSPWDHKESDRTEQLHWWEELTHWKKPWCWERLKARGEKDDGRWDGWMALPTQ